MTERILLDDDPAADFYRGVVERIPAITYVAAWDERSSTIYTSPQVERLLGFTQAEWQADPLFWLGRIHAEDREWVLDALEQLRAGAEPVAMEYRVLARDGRALWFRDVSALRRDADGRPLALYGILTDITAQKQIEEELAALRRRLAAEQIGAVADAGCYLPPFSVRELAVLRLLALGRRNREIAAALGISVKTVEKHASRIYARLGVHSRAEAVAWAVRVGLV